MSTVIDAYALIAFLRDEPGADVVENVLSAPEKCYAHALNLCEVYYDFFRASNQDAAEAGHLLAFAALFLPWAIRRAVRFIVLG